MNLRYAGFYFFSTGNVGLYSRKSMPSPVLSLPFSAFSHCVLLFKSLPIISEIHCQVVNLTTRLWPCFNIYMA